MRWEGALAGGVLLLSSIFVAQIDQKHLLLVDAALKEEVKPLGK